MDTPLNVLIVEDSPDDAELLVQELRRAGFEPHWKRVESEPDFLAELENTPDLVLSDYTMPTFSGLRAVDCLRENGLDIPFILVSGTVGEEAAVKAMKHGATDYLLKDRIGRLGNAVERALEQKRLRDERRRMEQQLVLQATALETAANAIIVTDREGRILWANQAFATVTGYTVAEVIGKTPRVLKSGKHDERFYRDFWKSITSGQTWCGEFINRRKDGSLFYEEHTVTPVRSENGTITHFVGIMHDITARRHAEEAARLKQECKIRHQAALLKLASQGREQFEDALREILKTSAQTLGVGRVSYWSLREEPSTIVCEVLYLAQTDSCESGAELRSTDYPRYFQSLQSNPLIAAEDAQTDLRTAEFAEAYLRPLGIASMLNVPVWLRGKLAGVVCHEHLGDRRTWSADEQDFALSIGHMVSLALGEREVNLREQRLNSFFTGATAGLVLLDRDLRFVQINDTLAGMNGVPAKEHLGKTVREVLPKLAPALEPMYQQVLATGAPFLDVEVTGETPRQPGVQRHWVESFFPITGKDGKPEGVGGIVVEITERKRAEEAMRESEHRFREMLENVQFIAMTLDTNGIITFCNDYLLQLTGWNKTEVIGQDWFEKFMPEADTTVRRLFFENIRAGKIPVHYENPIKTKYGESRQIRWNNTMLRDMAGNFVGTASLGEDITERKRAEEGLRESEVRFRQLAENINEVFWITDPTKNQILYVSPAYEAIWGRFCASLLESPHTWLEAIHPEDRERVVEAAQTKQVRGDYDETYRITRPDGSVRWIRDRAFPIRDATGEVYRIVGTAADITGQRNLEQQLRHMQKMESIGQLAAGVAHDFNNILAVIRGNAELALMGPGRTANQLVEHLKQITAASERAANLTRQLLMFAHKQVMQERLLDLNEVVSNMIKMLKRILGEDIALEVRYGSDLSVVRADVGMMEQVVMNLAVNARDAMPHGGRLIISTAVTQIDEGFVESNPQATPGNYVCLSVSDTGCGIHPDIQGRIFDPFFTTKGAGKGTGLGLATVYGIVRQHKGWVTVYSEVDRGAVFRIYLPVAESRIKDRLQREVEPEARGGTEMILLAEDEPAVRALMRNVLERYGYTVIEAESGVKALKLWDKHRDEIDLVLTDMVMPDGMTGRKLAEKIHAEKPAFPVIYTSGYSADIVGKDFELKEGDNFLQKPCAPRKLAQAVRHCLDESER